MKLHSSGTHLRPGMNFNSEYFTESFDFGITVNFDFNVHVVLSSFPQNRCSVSRYMLLLTNNKLLKATYL